MVLSKGKKTVLGAVLLLLLLGGGLHFWFSQNAARYLETIVSEQSKGRLHLKVKGFSYNLFTGFVEIKQGSLRSFDSLAQPATYDVRLDKLTLHLQSFWPLLIQRKLLLDSVLVQNPGINIYRWRKDPLLVSRREEVSLPSELGRIYQSLLDGLNAMELKHISVTGASLMLYDKMKPASLPVAIRGIDFNLTYPGSEIGGTPNARLRIPAQQVDLPNGRYRLSFKQILLEQFGKRLQLDSCTILTRNNAAKRSRFDIYFKKVVLSGMDFEALYRYNIIRADSVFCTSPHFRLLVRQNTAVKKQDDKAAPKEVIANIMDDIGADMDLSFIGIRDAGFDLQLQGKKQRTISNAKHDDFSLRQLRIKADSNQPFSIGGLDMRVRGYELYNEDSSAVFRFDSVLLRNNRIILRQFSATTVPGRAAVHNERRYSIPYFELENIDWYALIFEERLQARNVYLVNPQIYFRSLKPRKDRRRQSIFDLLESAGELVSLEKIHVSNGQLHLVPNDHTDIRLNNANLVLRTASFLAARNESGIKNSVEELSFSNGTVTFEKARIALSRVVYPSGQGLRANEINIATSGIKARLQGVSFANAFVNREDNSIHLQGLAWSKGNIDLQSLPGGNLPRKKTEGWLEVTDVKGQQTQVIVQTKNGQFSTFVTEAGLARLTRQASGAMAVAGLYVQGRDVHLNANDLQGSVAQYRLDQNGHFAAQNINLHQYRLADSLAFSAVRLQGIVNINGLLQKEYEVASLHLEDPSLLLHGNQKEPHSVKSKKDISTFVKIRQAVLERPTVDLKMVKEDSTTAFRMPAAAKGNIVLSNIFLSKDSMALGKVLVQTGSVAFEGKNGQRLGTDNGSVYLEASGLQRAMQGGRPAFSGTVDSVVVTEPLPLLVGKKKGRLSISRAAAGNIRLPGDGRLASLWHLPDVWLRTGTGSWRDSNTVMHWVGARFEAGVQQLSLDSFALEPAPGREAFIASHPYQTDYITLHSGPLQITGFNRELFEAGSLQAGNITVQRPVITIYRDKRPPFFSGIQKPLPTNKLQQIEMPLNIGQVRLVNGLVAYTELNDKTNEEGIVTLTNLNATIDNIRNRNITAKDSLLVRMNALLLDSAALSLQLRESYADSLAGFIMQLRMRPTSLSFLNPVVAPLSSVNIVSGTVDSLYLNAIGREHMALGEMHLFYRNLRIRLVQFGDNRKPKLLLALASFLANNLIIRKNNNGRKSLMYFERLQDRSVFNYLVKMTLNGITSGVGVKRNKKVLKQYHKDLERLQLPSFSNEARMEELVKDKEK